MNFRRQIYLIFFFGFLLSQSAFAQEFDQQAGFWSATKVYGRFYNEKLNYQAELHLRFMSEDPIFDHAVARFGLGYGFTPDVSLWVGYDFLPLYNVFVDKIEFEQRVWQQLLIHLVNRPRFKFDFRTRLEQRDDLDENIVAWRLRQMFTLLFSSEVRGKVTPFISDEIFINLNHPAWVSQDTVSQNRLFVGVLIPWEKYATFRVSYLNQILVVNQIKLMRHIFYISLILKHDLL